MLERYNIGSEKRTRNRLINLEFVVHEKLRKRVMNDERAFVIRKGEKSVEVGHCLTKQNMPASSGAKLPLGMRQVLRLKGKRTVIQ